MWTTPRTALSAAAVSTVNRSTPKRRVSSHRLDQDESENGASDFGFDRLSLTLSCPMNLKLFPLDKQTCSLSMVSCEYALSLVLELVRQDPRRALLADDIYRGTNKNRSRSLCRSTISKNVSSGTLAPPIDRLYLAAFIGLLIRTGLYIFFLPAFYRSVVAVTATVAISDGWTTDDLVFLWRAGDPVQVAKNLQLPRFSLQKFKTDSCNSKTNTGRSLVAVH